MDEVFLEWLSGRWTDFCRLNIYTAGSTRAPAMYIFRWDFVYSMYIGGGVKFLECYDTQKRLNSAENSFQVCFGIKYQYFNSGLFQCFLTYMLTCCKTLWAYYVLGVFLLMALRDSTNLNESISFWNSGILLHWENGVDCSLVWICS